MRTGRRRGAGAEASHVRADAVAAGRRPDRRDDVVARTARQVDAAVEATAPGRHRRAAATRRRRRRAPRSPLHAHAHTQSLCGSPPRAYIIYVAYNVAACGRSCGLPGLRRGGGGRLAGAAVLCCLVWRCELTAGQVRSASECVRRSHCTAGRTPTLGRLNSHRHTRHDKTVVSGVAV